MSDILEQIARLQQALTLKLEPSTPITGAELRGIVELAKALNVVRTSHLAPWTRCAGGIGAVRADGHGTPIVTVYQHEGSCYLRDERMGATIKLGKGTPLELAQQVADVILRLRGYGLTADEEAGADGG